MRNLTNKKPKKSGKSGVKTAPKETLQTKIFTCIDTVDKAEPYIEEAIQNWIESSGGMSILGVECQKGLDIRDEVCYATIRVTITFEE